MPSNKRYIPRSIPLSKTTVHDSVMAIKLTERNIDSSQAWLRKFGADTEYKVDVDKHGDEANHRIKIKTPKGWRVAKVGEYVVRHFNYSENKPFQAGDAIYYFTVGKDEFEKEYELATPGFFEK